MIDLTGYLPFKRKSTPSGWISFNAVCCHHNGSSQDRRGRGGLKSSEQSWSYHCFNCGFTASFILGRHVSVKARKLMSWLGVPDSDIEHLNLESLKHKNIHGILDDRQRIANALVNISFEERDLPPFAELLTQEGNYRDYVRQRGVPDDYPIMIQPNNDGIHWTRPHVVVPFTYEDKIVGWTCRFLDNKSPKYLSDSQPNYVFGTDLQHNHWKYAIVVEGIFDALCINGLAVMHNTISEGQARLLRNLDREIIVVPDRDKAGLELISRAIELGWAVSIPEWDDHIKDVNDAVVQYGKLPTLASILSAAETSKVKIEIQRKKLEKKIKKAHV